MFFYSETLTLAEPATLPLLHLMEELLVKETMLTLVSVERR